MKGISRVAKNSILVSLITLAAFAPSARSQAYGRLENEDSFPSKPGIYSYTRVMYTVNNEGYRKVVARWPEIINCVDMTSAYYNNKTSKLMVGTISSVDRKYCTQKSF